MNHPAAVPPVNVPDHTVIEQRASADIASEIDKAMGLVLWDGQPIAFVGCWMTLWACVNSLFHGLPYGERHTVSVAWLPFGHLGPDSVDSLHIDQSIWLACCEDEDRMRDYWRICFGRPDDDDADA